MNTGIVPIVIPALNPPPGLVSLVQHLIALGAEEVVVVDDGSSLPHKEAFAELRRTPGVTVLNHAVNQGKGAALRSATLLLKERADVVGMVTADADGQHLPTDIMAVVGALREQTTGAAGSPLAILGSRCFTGPGVPLRSRFGNRMTTAVIAALYGRGVPDTQTGLRGFTRSVFDDLLAVPGDRYQYEMRVLLRLLRSGVPVAEMPIQTVYTDSENSTSHFRPVRDSAVIYGVILREGGAFGLASLVGAVIDLAIFALIMDVAFGGTATSTAVLVATVGARVVSTLTNYWANRRLVFRSRRAVSTSVPRYYVLAIGLLAGSWLLTTVLADVLNGHVVWAKMLVDSGLFVVSYIVQKRWVFDGTSPALDRRPVATGTVQAGKPG